MRTIFFIYTACLLSAKTKAQVNTGQISLPLDKIKINSEFGIRKHPISGKRSNHGGLDLNARSDTVRSILNGVILSLSYEYGLGINIKIKHFGGLVTVYGHLSQPFLLAGDTVNAGQPIGISGKTGHVTGEHLHFEVRSDGIAMDPLKFLFLMMSGYIKNQMKTTITEPNDK